MRPQNFTKLHWTYIWHELYFSEGETSNEPRLDASGEVGHFIWRRFVGMGTCGSGSSLGGFRRTLASSNKWPRVCLLRGGKFLNLHRTSGKKGWLPLLHHLTVYLWFEFFLYLPSALSDSRICGFCPVIWPWPDYQSRLGTFLWLLQQPKRDLVTREIL